LIEANAGKNEYNNFGWMTFIVLLNAEYLRAAWANARSLGFDTSNSMNIKPPQPSSYCNPPVQ
jgi:hypothetical protein